ncbi:sigma-70 family RNA polymerase sigma factor, partial [Streptomyces sp. NPDC002346]
SGGAGACTGGIVEDEATGAAALLLSAQLGRARHSAVPDALSARPPEPLPGRRAPPRPPSPASRPGG